MYMGTAHILQIYLALYFLNMKVNPIPPFIMRLAGIHIDECPTFLAKDPSHKNHSVYFEEDDFRIPLQLHNTVSYIPIRIPSTHEFHDCVSHELIPNTSDWNPHDPAFTNEENSMVDHRGEIINNKRRNISTTSQLTTSDIDSIAISPTLTNISGTFNIFQFAEDIQNKKYSIKYVTSSGRKSNITVKFLADLWHISPSVAHQQLMLQLSYVFIQLPIQVSPNSTTPMIECCVIPELMPMFYGYLLCIERFWKINASQSSCTIICH
mmetsp:Transcript_1845/g.3756  ORF Transcript_1845/g.3756 Transcript_1845/m.3756 type:complete len:266 (-) Transcript_1845:3420-4217(-)